MGGGDLERGGDGRGRSREREGMGGGDLEKRAFLRATDLQWGGPRRGDHDVIY